ncbi:MAG TPA: glycoside hydrolase family 5 protein [Verrucomicrobiae bacterium]|nr:glycoside hydrolase family 5 protein [Verrucomicrobiae bacterium]
MSGAEFGMTVLPGTVPQNYSYPTFAEVDYYKSKGMNFIRLPFRWERWQHTNFATLDATELGRAHPFIAYATSKGMAVLIDPHNFMRYYPNPRSDYQTSTDGLVGSSVPDAVFTNFWSQVAAIYKTNNLVFFGLNNEPANMSTDTLVVSENAAITAIRDTGATNLIFVPGNGYTGAWTWTQNYYGTANSLDMIKIVDPGSNFVFEAHQYLDQDGSGTTTNIYGGTGVGPARLSTFTQWLRVHHYTGFLGEFALANNTIGGTGQGGATLTNMLSYIQTNSDVWLGWAWWGGGPSWGNYMYSIEPTSLGKANQADRPVMGVVKHFFPFPSAALRITNSTQLSFTPAQGFIYQLQSSSDLSAWNPSGAPFAGSGNVTNISLPVSGNSSGFYRISVGHAP